MPDKDTRFVDGKVREAADGLRGRHTPTPSETKRLHEAAAQKEVPHEKGAE